MMLKKKRGLSGKQRTKEKTGSGKGRRQDKKVTAIRAGGINSLDEAESRAIEKVSHTLSTIENAIAVWDAAKNKPVHLRARVDRLRQIHEALVRWERKALKAKAEQPSLEQRMCLMHEFSEMCSSFK